MRRNPARRRHPVAPLLTVGVGLALLAWLSVQIAIIGFSLNPPLQPVHLLLGVAVLAVGVAWQLESGLPRRRTVRW